MSQTVLSRPRARSARERRHDDRIDVGLGMRIFPGHLLVQHAEFGVGVRFGQPAPTLGEFLSDSGCVGESDRLPHGSELSGTHQQRHRSGWSSGIGPPSADLIMKPRLDVEALLHGPEPDSTAREADIFSGGQRVDHMVK